MINKPTAIITLFILLMLSGIGTASSLKQTQTLRKDHSVNFIFFTPHFDMEHKEFNWRALLAPFAVSFLWKTDKSQTIIFNLPYEFSRGYNTGKPINPQDYEKVKQYIETVLQQKLISNIYAFQSEEDAFKKKFFHDIILKNNIAINAIHITGFSSPEADNEGSEQPGTIDSKNIKLAGLRSSHSGRALEEVLIKLGITYSRESITYENNEIQFSESEIKSLKSIAAQNNIRSIFLLLKRYDEGNFSDQKITKELDSLVGSKRKVSILIDLGDKKQNIVIIPLPVLLLLAFIALYSNRNKFHLKRNRKQTIQKGLPSDNNNTEIISSKTNTLRPCIVPLKSSDKNDDLIRHVKIEKDIEIYISDVIVDLNNNFDFYRRTLEAYKNDSLSDPHASINSLAHDMLLLWMEHDNNLRVNENQQPEDHFSNISQITYAVLHAIVLRRIIIDMRRTGNKNITGIIDVTEVARDELRKFNEYL
jgi:flagellar biosynthesis regulator FlaF